jgi:hypothetical protein
MLGIANKPTAGTSEAVVRQLAGFTFQTQHGAPGEIFVEGQAVDQYSQSLECAVVVVLWLSDSRAGIGVAGHYLFREARDRIAPPAVRCVLGTLFGIDSAQAIVRIQTTNDGRFAVRFSHSNSGFSETRTYGCDHVFVAAQAGNMLAPSVSRKLGRDDFGKDLERPDECPRRDPIVPPSIY